MVGSQYCAAHATSWLGVVWMAPAPICSQRLSTTCHSPSSSLIGHRLVLDHRDRVHHHVETERPEHLGGQERAQIVTGDRQDHLAQQEVVRVGVLPPTARCEVEIGNVTQRSERVGRSWGCVPVTAKPRSKSRSM